MTTRAGYATTYPMANSFYQSVDSFAEMFIFTVEVTFHLHGKVNRPMYAYGKLKTHMLQLSTSRILRN